MSGAKQCTEDTAEHKIYFVLGVGERLDRVEARPEGFVERSGVRMLE